jgi:PAS domain-containing protein
LLLVIFLPAFGIIVISGIKQRRQEITKAQNNALLLVQSLAAQQEHIATSTKAMLTVLARTPAVQHLDAKACNRLFAELEHRFPLYSAVLAAATPDGRMFAASKPFSPGKVDLSDRKHVKDAIRTLDFSVGEYIQGRVSGVSSLNYAFPVLDTRQKLIAIVIAGFNLGEYAHFIANSELPPGYSVNIADWNGVRLFRTPEHPETSPGASIPRNSLTLVSAAEHGFFEKKSTDGKDRIYAFKEVRLNEQSPPYMYIVVGIPKAEIIHKANMQMLANLLALGITVLVTMSWAWFFGEFLLVRPINRLVAATRQFGEGELNTRTGLPHGSDELGRLAQSFDYMAARLEDQRSKIEATVAERTAELRAAQHAGRIGSWKWTLGSDTITWSEELYRIVGRDPIQPEPTIPEHAQLYTPESWVRLQDAIRTVMEDPHGVREIDLELIRPDGTQRWVLARCEPKRDADGRPIAIHGTLQDITERKHTEQELVEAKNELEQRVAERTRELREQIVAKDRAHAKLQEAQKRIIEVSRLSGMAEVATGCSTTSVTCSTASMSEPNFWWTAWQLPG